MEAQVQDWIDGIKDLFKIYSATPPAAQPAPVPKGWPSDDLVTEKAKQSGFDLSPTPNMLYTVRGNHAQLVNFARAMLSTPPAATVEDSSQNWAGMDGTTAWHLIDRHADGWADIGKMMGEWLAANSTPTAAQPAPVQEPVGMRWRWPGYAWVYTEEIRSDLAGNPEKELLYTPPPTAQRTWVDLTDDDLIACSDSQKATVIFYMKKLKEKNT